MCEQWRWGAKKTKGLSCYHCIHQNTALIYTDSDNFYFRLILHSFLLWHHIKIFEHVERRFCAISIRRDARPIKAGGAGID